MSGISALIKPFVVGCGIGAIIGTPGAGAALLANSNTADPAIRLGLVSSSLLLGASGLFMAASGIYQQQPCTVGMGLGIAGCYLAAATTVTVSLLVGSTAV